MRNCDGQRDPLPRCPWSAPDEVWECIGWWSDWKTYGMLPWDGEMSDQPAFVVQAVQLVEGLRSKLEGERTQKQIAEIEKKEREAKRKQWRS